MLCIRGYKKSIRAWLLGTFISLSILYPIQSNAIDLENPNMCSSGITNMMSSMGLMAYSMADFMNGFCKMMPFFGSFCPDLDQMAGSFFSKVLENPDLTLDMLACADHNSSMLSFMLHVIDENPELLDQMGNYMGQTGEGDSAGKTKGCILGERFTNMATRHSNLKNFFFAKINEDLYLNYSDNLFHCEGNAVEDLSILIKNNPKQAMEEDSAFGKVLRSIHPAGTDHNTPGGHDHSLHDANEKMFYSIFSNVTAALNFMEGMSQIDDADRVSMLDFMFKGTIHNKAVTCSYWDWRCTPKEASTYDHPFESAYYMYSMIKAMNDGVIPEYQLDNDTPPTTDSPIPANRLFGQFMPMMLDENGQMNEYGMSFFTALISGALSHQWEPAGGVMGHMVQLMTLGHVPFTMADMGQMMSVLNRDCWPDPNDLFNPKEDDHGIPCESDSHTHDGSTPDDDHDDDTTPPQPTTTTEHFSGNLRWYEDVQYGPFEAGDNGLSVTVSGSGDVSLYVREVGKYRSPYDYRYRNDCASENYNSSNESCDLRAGSYYVIIDGDGRAYESDYTLSVTY